jgi:ABC-2 type transport system ATP-binding protein
LPPSPPPPSSFGIVTRGLSRTFGALRALDQLDLEVKRGSLFALLGPNGAGKSTTIAILTTTLAPTSGSAAVAGFDVVAQPREVRRSMGVVFQDISLDDRLTAHENLELHAAIYGIPGRERAARIAARLEAVGLTPASGQRVRTFSGGMKRRLELARVLLHEPQVVILDEPTVGLDPQTRRRVWDELAAMAAQRERTVFVTTHYMDEAERCDDVAVIDHGKLIARGSPRELAARVGVERLVVRTPDPAATGAAARSLGWKVTEDDGLLTIEGDRPEAMLARLAGPSSGGDRAAAIPIEEARIVRPTLEDVFVDLTGRDLRDMHDDDAGRHDAMRTNLRARGRR